MLARVDRPAVRSRVRRHRAAARRRLGRLRGRRADHRARHDASSPRRLRPRRPRSSSTPTRGRTPGIATMTVDGRSVRLVPLRVGTKPIGLLAAVGPADRGRHARHAGRRRGHRDRARAVSRGAQGRRADAPERGTEDRAAGVARARPAHAADGDSRRREQSQGVCADRRRSARAERPDPGGSRAPDAAVPEHPRDGAHRCRRGRRRVALGASVGDHRRGARPGRAHAAAAPARRARRSGRARAARSAADRDGAGARAGERRAVLAGRVSPSTSLRASTDDGLVDSGARSRSRHRAGRPAAPVRSLLPRRRGEDARRRAPAWACGSRAACWPPNRAASGPRTVRTAARSSRSSSRRTPEDRSRTGSPTS